MRTPSRRILLIALLVVALDQLTKQLVLRFLGYAQEMVVSFVLDAMQNNKYGMREAMGR